MKKLISILAITAMALIACVGCGGKKESAKDVSIDVTKLCQELEGTVESTLSEVNVDIIGSTFGIDTSKVAESCAALNSGSNACEVVVLKCSDSDYAATAVSMFEQRRDMRSESFASYGPDEVTKLEKAIIKSTGDYVVYCVSDDAEAAEKIVKEAGF